MSLADRYEGKPLLRLIELYVLWAIDDLSEHDAQAMERMAPQLAEAFDVTGTWQQIVAQVMEFPEDMRERTRELWQRQRERSAARGQSVSADAFARKLADGIVTEPVATN